MAAARHAIAKLRRRVSAANSGAFGHSERSEESQIVFLSTRPEPNNQRCFAQPVLSEVEGLNMTGGPGDRDVAKKTSCTSALIMLISAS